jgi:hypothetical protein
MMPRIIILMFTLLLSSSIGNAAEYFVSLRGNDSNGGTIDKPWRTLQKAADALQPGDVCYVRGGTWRESVDIRRSGEPGKPIRFAAYRGELVILSGTEPITGNWSLHEGHIYKMQMESPVSQLFVNGRMMIEARWPNQPFDKRWDTDTWRTAGEGSAYGRIVDHALGETGIDWSGSLAVLNIGSFITYLRRIDQYTTGSDILDYPKTMGTRLEQQVKPKAGYDHYYMMGKLEALDSAGEWYQDSETRTLYCWMLDWKHPATHGVEGKVRDYAVTMKNQQYVEISGFHFFATTFKIENSDNCLVENVHLNYATYARLLKGGEDLQTILPKSALSSSATTFEDIAVLPPTYISGSENIVRNSSFAYSDGPGLVMTGDKHLVENCLIHDTDWRGLANGVSGNAAALEMRGTSNSTVRYCTVYNAGGSEVINMPRNGVNVAEYNYIHHGALVQHDGSLIQAGSIHASGTVMRYNWVHDHFAYGDGKGLRGDDLTRGLTVHHNVVWNCDNKAIIVKGDSNRVYNNTIFGNEGIDLILTRRPEPYKSWNPSQWPHLLEEQNVHSETVNNAAPNLTGRFPQEPEQQMPLGKVEHNFQGENILLADPRAFDFRPQKESPLVDAGEHIPGYTDGYQGKSPDIGAYEYGGERWVPGYRNSIYVSETEPVVTGDANVGLKVGLTMPPVEPVIVRAWSHSGPITMIKGRFLKFTADNWMYPLDVLFTAADGEVRIEAEPLDQAAPPVEKVIVKVRVEKQ